MSLELVLLFGCVVLVTCRTVTIEKTSLSLNEESEDSEAHKILKSFLDHFDVTSGEKLSLFSPGCRKGQCQYCMRILEYNACFVATSDGSSVVIQLTLDERTVLRTSISASNLHPPKICKEKIAGVNALTNVCVQVKKIDLKGASGCVDVSYKVNAQSYTKEVCFEIPQADYENDESDSAVQDGDVVEFEPTDSNA